MGLCFMRGVDLLTFLLVLVLFTFSFFLLCSILSLYWGVIDTTD